MLTFQLIVIPLLMLVALSELRAIFRVGMGRLYHTVRFFIIVAAIVAIWLPDLTGWAAQLVGITRGTDLVIYVFMLFTIAALFRLYTAQFLLEQRIARMARVDALANAKPGAPGGSHIPRAPDVASSERCDP